VTVLRRVARLAFAALAFAAAATERPARADNAACVTSAEDGQRDRGAGKLRSAAKKFVVCADPACPVVVQRDCAKWAAEVADATPTVVVDAHDGDDHDVLDVAVTIDGESLGATLDGKAIPVDPGTHVIAGRRPNGEEVKQTIVAKEGAKARPVRLVFRGVGASWKVDLSDTAPSASRSSSENTEGSSGHSVVPWIIMAAGGATLVAGLVVMLTPPALPSNCSETTKKCVKLPGESEEQFDHDTNDAGRYSDQPRLGLAIGGVGLGIAAIGLAWYFLEPTGRPKSSKRAHLAPWLSPDMAGLSVTGSL
jgi:hypothetical protein